MWSFVYKRHIIVMVMLMKKISIVVPMYNEQEVAPLFFDAITKVVDSLKDKYEFEIVAVNDGSKDSTLSLLLEKQKELDHLVVVDLSRNWGHESAVLAGLQTATGDAIIPMDADLQDPPEIIPQMIEMWEDGYKVVNAKRGSRDKDTSFKKNTAGIYYKLLDSLSGKVKIPDNVANFRLIDRQVLDEVLALQEKNRVFRVEVPYVGFKTGEVLFAREERTKGESKYNFKAMFNLALSSIVSVSNNPLGWTIPLTSVSFIITILSIITELVFYILYKCNVFMSIDSFSYGIWLIVNVILLLASFIFLTLGIIAVYMMEVVTESRGRPAVIINKVYRKDK